MYPEKHVKDIESSDRRERILKKTGVPLVFLVSVLILGPLIHEAAHVAVLYALRCNYIVESGFNLLGGLHAGIKPICQMSDTSLVTFYSAGYAATLGFGSALNMLSSLRKSKVVAAAGTGMLLSIVLSLGSGGDIGSLLAVLESPGYESAANILLIMFALSGSLIGARVIGN